MLGALIGAGCYVGVRFAVVFPGAHSAAAFVQRRHFTQQHQPEFALPGIQGLGSELFLLGCQQVGGIFVNPRHQSVTGSGNHAAFVHFEQLLQQFLVLPVGLSQCFPLGGVVRILEGEQGRAGTQGLLRLGVDDGHRAREGRGVPGAVDFQNPLPRTGNGNPLAHLVALVFDGHNQQAAEVTLHPAGDFLAVRQGNGHRFSGGQGGIHSEPDAHLAVQAQYRQSPMLQHDGLHPVALLGVDQFHPAPGGGRDLRGRLFIGHSRNLLSHRGHGILNLRNGGHDADLVHSRKRVALADKIPVFHKEFRNFHIFWNRDILGIPGFQGSAAVDGGADGAHGGVGAENAGLGAVLLLLLPGHQGHERQSQHNKRQHAPEDVPPY